MLNVEFIWFSVWWHLRQQFPHGNSTIWRFLFEYVLFLIWAMQRKSSTFNVHRSMFTLQTICKTSSKLWNYTLYIFIEWQEMHIVAYIMLLIVCVCVCVKKSQFHAWSLGKGSSFSCNGNGKWQIVWPHTIPTLMLWKAETLVCLK